MVLQTVEKFGGGKSIPPLLIVLLIVVGQAIVDISPIWSGSLARDLDFVAIPCLLVIAWALLQQGARAWVNGVLLKSDCPRRQGLSDFMAGIVDSATILPLLILATIEPNVRQLIAFIAILSLVILVFINSLEKSWFGIGISILYLGIAALYLLMASLASFQGMEQPERLMILLYAGGGMLGVLTYYLYGPPRRNTDIDEVLVIDDEQ